MTSAWYDRWGSPWRWLRRAWQCLTADSWRLALCRVLVVVAAIGLGGLLFVSAGLMPIAASAGHWPITKVFLKFTMRSSVRTQTLGMDVPPLDDPALVLKGAGHYATGCLPCHGAPGQPRSLIVQQMLPEPPYLPPLIPELAPEELYWVVKHGIKYTAMPAWVAQQRDDEVWAMVAFLRRLPQLDAAQFRQLAYGESAVQFDPARIDPIMPVPQPPILENCVRCHGSDGDGRGSGAFPRLAGQSEAYLLASLQAFARGDRRSGVMQPVAAGLSARAMQEMAQYYAALDSGELRAEEPANNADAAAITRGALLAHNGDSERRIPSCVACHGPGSVARNPPYPQLAGQHVDYLALQLTLFKQDQRGGTVYADIMTAIGSRLDERDIRDLSLYYASLSSQRSESSAKPTAAP